MEARDAGDGWRAMKVPNPELKRELISLWISQTKALRDAVMQRLLPTFANIRGEADKIEKKKWDEIMEGVGSSDRDPSDFVEKAMDAGIDHYITMKYLRDCFKIISPIFSVRYEFYWLEL